MDHSNYSKIDTTHSIIEVKLEPFDEVEDNTQNFDPLEPDTVCSASFKL